MFLPYLGAHPIASKGGIVGGAETIHIDANHFVDFTCRCESLMERRKMRTSCSVCTTFMTGEALGSSSSATRGVFT